MSIDELFKIDVIDTADVNDTTNARLPKTDPAYFSAYDQFYELCDGTAAIRNLFMIGRNGMHRYNNADQRMLTAIVAAGYIPAGETQKDKRAAAKPVQENHEPQDWWEK